MCICHLLGKTLPLWSSEDLVCFTRQTGLPDNRVLGACHYPRQCFSGGRHGFETQLCLSFCVSLGCSFNPLTAEAFSPRSGGSLTGQSTVMCGQGLWCLQCSLSSIGMSHTVLASVLEQGPPLERRITVSSQRSHSSVCVRLVPAPLGVYTSRPHRVGPDSTGRPCPQIPCLHSRGIA